MHRIGFRFAQLAKAAMRALDRVRRESVLLRRAVRAVPRVAHLRGNRNSLRPVMPGARLRQVRPAAPLRGHQIGPHRQGQMLVGNFGHVKGLPKPVSVPSRTVTQIATTEYAAVTPC